MARLPKATPFEGQRSDGVLLATSSTTTPIEQPMRAFLGPLGGSHAAEVLPSREATANALRRDAIFRRLLAVADAAAAGVALLSMIALGRASSARPGALVAVAAAVVAAKLLGLYDRDELVFHKSTLDEIPALFHLATLYALLIWLMHGQVLRGTVGQSEVLLFWGLFLSSDIVLRLAGRRIARAIGAPERCLLVGQSSARVRFASKLAQVHSRVEIVGSLPLNDERQVSTERRGGARGVERRRNNLHIDDLVGIVRDADVHRVIIIPGSSDPEEMLDSIGRAKSLGVKVSIVPRLFEIVGSSVEFDDLEGLTVLGVRRFGLSRSSRLLKRTFDVVGTSILLVLLAPLFALVAVLIRADSRGPVFFRQTRVGLDGRYFEMFKFRSMVDGAEAQREALRDLNETQGIFKITRDPRVTPVGRMLRRVAVDELPQLLNVLRGDMSLVGPRPLVVDEDRKVAGRHRGRLRLVPGITGPWQLLGPTRVPLKEMVTIDYLYGANWSLWNDIKILLRTVAYVVNRRGL
jgi:exopolysaccharide biosynthesis polyprenyl glycosylphosphotransferase